MEGVLHCAGPGIPEHDSGDYRCNGKSLLDGCAGGERRGLSGISVQWGVLGAVAGGRLVVMGVEIGETGTIDRGKVSAKRGTAVRYHSLRSTYYLSPEYGRHNGAESIGIFKGNKLVQSLHKMGDHE